MIVFASKENISNYIDLIFTTPEKYYILDTETTSLDGYICSISIIDLNGNVYIDQLVNPLSPISYQAYKVHKLSSYELIYKPSFLDIKDKIDEVLNSTGILIYNSSFDIRILCNEYKRLNLEIDTESINSVCVMKMYKQWINATKNLKLLGDHTSLGDCYKTLELLKSMRSL